MRTAHDCLLLHGKDPEIILGPTKHQDFAEELWKWRKRKQELRRERKMEQAAERFLQSLGFDRQNQIAHYQCEAPDVGESTFVLKVEFELELD